MSPLNAHKILYNGSQLLEMATQEKSTEVNIL